MRIALDARFLTHPQRGGFKTYTVNLVQALSQVDHENEYIVYTDRAPGDDGPLPLGDNMRPVVVGGTTPIVGMPVREQITLRRQIARDEPDLVHFLCNTATVGLRCAHVVTLHDTIQVTATARAPLTSGFSAIRLWAQTAYSRRTIRPVARTASHLITVSEYERGQIGRALNLPLDKITVTYGAPDPICEESTRSQRENAAILDSIGVSGPYLLSVGYEVRKNIPVLIDAFAELAAEFGSLELVIVAAQADARSGFTSLLDRHGLVGRSHVLGSTTSRELLALYTGAEVFVFPSEREAFGLPVIEAMACGTPTVVMKASCLPEIVGEAATLVEGKDPLLWAHTIRRLLLDRALRDQSRSLGLARASQFSWSRCARETIAVYQDVCAAAQSRKVYV